MDCMKKPRINGIHHVAIKCRGLEEFERTLHFYRDLLGMPEVRRWGVGAGSAVMLDTGAGLFEIFASGGSDTSRGAFHHVALATEDPDACIDAVRREGYAVTMEPKEIAIPSEPPYPARIAFCIGPVGEEVEFFCVK